FLRGFLKRIQRNYPEAERFFRKALTEDSNSPKSRRELVNVLLAQNKYEDALELAEKNYDNGKLNAFHIQAYFICLTKKASKTIEDLGKLDELMKNIAISHDYKSSEILA